MVPNADRDCRRCHRSGMTDDTPAKVNDEVRVAGGATTIRVTSVA
jgi:hypothetical protein